VQDIGVNGERKPGIPRLGNRLKYHRKKRRRKKWRKRRRRMRRRRRISIF
jgi:putative protein kinase ArgK-like GTPase of G3E family